MSDIWEKYSPHYQWWDCSFDQFKAIGAAIGFDIENIYFSGFSSQGDGACFTGTVEYRKGWKAALAGICGDSEVLDIAQRWQDCQKGAFYCLAGNIRHTGRYNHEYSTRFDWEDCRDSYRELPSGIEDTASDICRDYMRWIYSQLEREYEYQQAWQFAQAWDSLGDEMATLRSDARQLVRDMRAAIKSDIEAAPSICTALRQSLRTLLDAWETARDERESIADAFHYYESGKSVSIAEFAKVNL